MNEQAIGLFLWIIAIAGTVWFVARILREK